MKISIIDSIQNPVKNQLNFQKRHLNKKSVFKNIDSIQLQLDKLGYLNNRLDSLAKLDSTYTAHFFLGKSLKKIKIYYNKDLLSKKDVFKFSKNVHQDYFEINLNETPFVMNQITKHFEEQGKSFSEVRLSKITITENHLTSNLVIITSERRTIDKVVVRGYKKFPKTFLKRYLNLDSKLVFSSSKIKELSRKIKTLSFASEIKTPEVLFTNDSTYLYIYVKKQKANRFDGLIGFSSQENSNKLNLNGYLDLELNNIFNSGEQISFNWKNNGQERQFLNTSIKLPYIFNSPITPKFELNIYKQDSTFVNTKTKIELGYLINYRNNISLLYSSENSSNLLTNTKPSINNFKTNLFGIHYYYFVENDFELFPEKFNLSINLLTGKRKTNNINTNQSKINFSSSYLWSLNFKNHIFIKNLSGILFSKNYLTNELFRIGGINSIRGFNEESIYATSYSVFNFEYRHNTNNSSYLYTISDFGIIKNKLQTSHNNLYSIGLGYSFSTTLGKLNLGYSIGKFENTPFDFDNSKLYFEITTNF